MLEILLQRVALSGEVARMLAALLGTAVAAYYDVTNSRNVPNNFLYGFLGLSLALSVFFYQQEVFLYGFGVAAALFAIGMLFRNLGYIGGADVYVISSIALLLPEFPSHLRVLFNFPPVFSVIIASGVLFALYFFVFILGKIVLAGKKGRWDYLLLVPVYVALMYFLSASGIFGPAYVLVLSVLILSSILFMVYKEQVTEMMAGKIPLSKVDEEDVAVLELMPEQAKKYGMKRLLDGKEIARLKKAGLKELYVYTGLPPFLPFILAGLAITLALGDLLMYSINVY